jgi:hypothetical protein
MTAVAASWFYLRIVVTVVLCSWSGRPAGRPDYEHGGYSGFKSEALTSLKHAFLGFFILDPEDNTKLSVVPPQW